MLKKIFKVLIVVVIIIGIFKLLVFLTNPLTKKKEIDKANEVKEEANKTQALAFVKAVEEYCSLELVKGRPIPDRITNPSEVLFDGDAPREMDITLTNECRAKGTFTYGSITYEYDYETGKLTVK